MLRSFVQDVRYAFRKIRRHPRFAGLVALTLALGNGGATTVFSAIEHLLLHPFPYAHADGILVFQIRNPANPRGGSRSFFQVPELLEYQANVPAFADIVAIDAGRDVRLATPDGMVRCSGAVATENTFRFLGVNAAVGRVWAREDFRPGAAPVFVLSHKVWIERFGSDPSIVGRSFMLNDVPTTLVGIMPPRFALLAAELWQPATLDRAGPDSTNRFFHLQARLKAGVTVQQAETQFRVVAERLAAAYPRLYPTTFTVEATSLVDSMVGSVRSTLYTFAIAAAVLLLIACGNVANMLLARSRAREMEIAIQRSLGAGQLRLVQQMVAESVMLALLGAGGGLVLTYFGLKAIVALIPVGAIPPEAAFEMNPPVLLFSLGVACLCALVFGLVPSFRTARGGLTLLSAARSTCRPLRRDRLSGALVVIEVTLCLVLLAGAGLLTRSFIKLHAMDLGIDPENLLFVRVRVPPAKDTTAESRHAFVNETLRRLESLPGVTSAAASSAVPLGGGIRTGIGLSGRPAETGLTALMQLCTEKYFSVAGLRLIRGRLLSAADTASSARVTVVNATLARYYFGGEDALGRRITLTALQTALAGPVENPEFEIVGIVVDTKNHGMLNRPLPESFIPSSVAWANGRSFVLRTAVAPLTIARSVHREIQTVDRDVELLDTGTVTNQLSTFWYAEPRFALVIWGVFASVALVLCLLGIYGVIAYHVSQQTREIGIRMALGAQRGDVRHMVLLRGLRLIGSGVAIGVLIALAATRVLRSQLWGVTPTDPLTLATAVSVVVVAGIAACYVPARRATCVDPLVALRYE